MLSGLAEGRKHMMAAKGLTNNEAHSCMDTAAGLRAGPQGVLQELLMCIRLHLQLLSLLAIAM